MEEEAQLLKVERIISHIDQVGKTFKIEKHKDARELLLRQAMEGGEEEMKAVENFREVREVPYVNIQCQAAALMWAGVYHLTLI